VTLNVTYSQTQETVTIYLGYCTVYIVSACHAQDLWRVLYLPAKHYVS